jgi:anti-anti-sigma regulatory factor
MAEQYLTRDELSIDVRREAGTIVLSPVGELSPDGLTRLERALQEAADAGAGIPVVLDLERARFVDADGPGLVVRAGDLLEGRLAVRCSDPEVVRGLVIAGADRRLVMELRSSEAASADLGTANVAYVRRVWDAFEAGGAPALADLIPEDVVWRPASGDGQVLLGVRELIRFWAKRDRPRLSPLEFKAVGEDVLVHREVPGPGDRTRPMWSLYRFDGPRLIEVVSFDQAPAAAAP